MDFRIWCLIVVLGGAACVVRAVGSGSAAPLQSSAAVDAALAAGDFDRAVRLVRLARDPARLSAVWLRRAEALVDVDRARAKAALETVLAIVQRYDGMSSMQVRLALLEGRARRRLAELAFEDAVGATAIEQTIERLLPLVDGAGARAAWAGDAGMRLDEAGARDAAVQYFRRAVREGGESLTARWAGAAAGLLDGGIEGIRPVVIARVLALLSEAGQDRPLGYLLALYAEATWQTDSDVAMVALHEWRARYASRLESETTRGSRHRLNVHSVAVARRVGTAVPARALADVVEAGSWFSTAGRVRDAADAAVVAASLTVAGTERERLCEAAREAYGQLASVDRAASEAGLMRVVALGPARSVALALAYERGTAGPDPLIEDTQGFRRRVRASFAAAVREAFARGTFEAAFRRSQQAKLAEVGIRLASADTLGFDELARRYVLQPEDLQGPTVDLVAAYFVDDEATYLFGLRADAKRERFERIHQRIEITRPTLNQRVAEFIEALDGDSVEAGRTMFALLMQQAWGDWNGPWIVLAPDGPLRFLPFELLRVPGVDGPERTLLERMTSGRDAVDRHVAARQAVLRRPGPMQRNVLEARRRGLWPPAPGRMSHLPTVAALNNDSVATQETALSMWAVSATRLREELGPTNDMASALAVSAPSFGTRMGQGFVLSLWNAPSAAGAGSNAYVQSVFSLALPDLGRNLHGRIVGQLKRDLASGHRVEKERRAARLVPLEQPVSARDWARWVYVDLKSVRRPR